MFSHVCFWWPSLGAEELTFEPKAPRHVFEGLRHPPPFEQLVLFKAYDPIGGLGLGGGKSAFEPKAPKHVSEWLLHPPPFLATGFVQNRTHLLVIKLGG